MTTPFKTIICLCILLCSCEPEINYVARVKLQRLTLGDIYNKKKVKDVLFDAEENNMDSLRRKSRELFLSGIDALRNKHRPADAIEAFKSSLLYLPDSKTYYELGNALMEAGTSILDFKEAEDAYEQAINLDFKPKGLVLYKLAAAEYKGDTDPSSNYSVVQYLTEAFAQGFTDTVAMKKDKYLASFVDSEGFSEFRDRLRMLQVQIKPDELFQAYVSSFPKAGNEELAITHDDVALQDHHGSIGYEFVKFVPEMENTSFGRDVSHDFIYVANVRETPFYYALVYASVSYFGDELQPVHIKLVTYNHQGEIIAAKLLAGQFSAEKIKTGMVEKDKVTITEYTRKWEKPITETSPEENKIIGYDELAKAVFRINDDGTFRNESVPVEFRDSLMLTKN